MNNPSISVVLCSYNGALYIKEQILSIVAQTMLPKELIIGDDGSTDDTLAIVENLRPKIEGAGIQLLIYQHNHLGPHGNFKETLRKATCELIAPCDQDDIWLPEKLEKCAAKMTWDIDVVYCDEFILHENGNISNHCINPPESMADQLFGTHLAGHLLLLRREYVNVYDIAPEITFDYGITIAASCCRKIAHVQEMLCIWRRHDAVVTISSSNHNIYKQINKGKWEKWFGAIKAAMGGDFSIPVKKRYQSILQITMHYAIDNREKSLCKHICKCMESQNTLSILLAGWYYMLLKKQSNEYMLLNLRDKIAYLIYNFTYPAGWWYEYRVHKSL